MGFFKTLWPGPALAASSPDLLDLLGCLPKHAIVDVVREIDDFRDSCLCRQHYI